MSVRSEFVFDKEYILFSNGYLTPSRSEAECDLIESYFSSFVVRSILDLGCGTGRISKGLYNRGYQVTGVDWNKTAIEIAKSELDIGSKLLFKQSDYLKLNYNSEFDAVISWYTSFGYYDDDSNLDMLRKIYAAIKEGGVFILDHPNRDSVLKCFQKFLLEKNDGNIMLDEREYNVRDGFLYQKRHFIINGVEKMIDYKIRLYSFTEIVGLLKHVGFSSVDGKDENNKDFSLDSKRMVLIARK